jgi:hypothetical protein
VVGVIEKLSQKAMLAGIYQNLGIALKSPKNYDLCLEHTLFV